MGFVSRKDIARTLSVHSIEAVKAASAMEKGRFAFSSLLLKEMEKSMDKPVDFEQLYKEFTVNPGHYIFLKAVIEHAIIPTDTPNLSLMTAGPVPSNPSEMAGSDRTRYLIDYLKQAFDFIILDTPPVLPASDALSLAPCTDGTILVIKCGHTHRKAIKSTLDQFNTTHLPIIGTVLNHVDMKHEGYYRYYKKYYASYYGK
jgi:capsular exopolysaccharide synthesis family protein